MKSFGKIIMILLIGLTAAIVVYPFLHESGHSVAALMVGGRIIEYHLLPIPYVLCDVGKVAMTGQVFIGIGGMLLPIVIITVFNPQRRFWIWYGNLMLRGICILSVAITVVASFLYVTGNPVANEDITAVLHIAPDLTAAAIIASLLILVFLIIIIARDKPIKRICDYLLD